MKSQSLYPRLFALLALSFILCTIAGTLSHELGHMAVADHYGYKTRLSYAAVYYEHPYADEFRTRYEKDKEYIEADEDSAEKEAFLEYRNRLGESIKEEAFWITAGGPVQTMLTGTLGFLILWFRRKKIAVKQYLNVGEWAAVLLAFFWSRQVFNFISSLSGCLACTKNLTGDEPRISEYLGLPEWGLGFATFFVGSILLLWVTFRLIPAAYRFTFIIAGIMGSAAGWFIWMYWVGPQVLPV